MTEEVPVLMEVEEVVEGIQLSPGCSTDAKGSSKAPNPRHPDPSRGRPRQTRGATKSRDAATLAEEKDMTADEYIICNVSLLTSFIETQIKEHSDRKCKKPSIILHKTESRIISTAWKMCCNSCNYDGTTS